MLGNQKIHVVHVAESFAGGVLEAIRILATDQVNQGMRVSIIHGQRPESPGQPELNTMFCAEITRLPLMMSQGISPLRDLKALIALIKALRYLDPDIIHLHSSKAGLLGRIATYLMRRSQHTLYSPHGWAFLREDVSPWQRQLFLRIERAMAYFFGGTIVACSQHEYNLAKQRVKSLNPVLLRNAVAAPETIRRPGKSIQEKLRIITVGRVTEAKAPWRFAQLASTFAGPKIEFRWIGDYQHPLSSTWLSDSPITLTGQLDKCGVERELASADIFVLLSTWEGLPLALAEAQAMGLPALVSAIPGCLEVVIENQTGLVAHNEGDMVMQLDRLIQSAALRHKLGAAAQKHMRQNFSLANYYDNALALYFRIARSKDVR